MNSNDHPHLSDFATVYFGFHIAGGHVLLPIIILTFFLSKRVHRPATVINFCVTWVIYSVSYSLLMYRGIHNRPPPSYYLCLVQAALTHGATPMCVVAGLGVVVQAWVAFQLPTQPLPLLMFRLPRWAALMGILLPPYVVFCSFVAGTTYLGIKHPEAVIPSINGLYCTINVQPFRRFAVPMFCAGFMGIIIMLEIAMIVQYYKGWMVVKKVCPLATRRPSLSPWVRVSVFNLYSLVSLGACIFYLSDTANAVAYVVQATLPLVAALIFGSQTDILRTWFPFLKNTRPHEDPDYTPGGGWSVQSFGHMSLSSEV